jgi:hypothetical protein
MNFGGISNLHNIILVALSLLFVPSCFLRTTFCHVAPFNRGIQSRRFGRDPVVVSQSFLVGFISGETALNRPATLNVSFQFVFLMSVSQREYMELPLSSAYIP